MRRLVRRGMEIKNMEFASENIILIKIQEKCDSDTLFILNEGLSMSVNAENIITEHDPFLTIPGKKEFSRQLNGDVIEMYFTFSSKGLNESGIELAEYMQDYARVKYKHIIMIGHSKAGVCFANAARFFNPNIDITMILISTPFKGTIIADEDEMKKRMSKVKYYIYSKIFNNHAVDKDLIPSSEFMLNTDFSGVKKIKCINIISQIKSIYDIKDIGCKYLGRIARIKKSDGIVSVSSQEALKNVITIYIDASHATSLDRVLSGKLGRYII